MGAASRKLETKMVTTHGSIRRPRVTHCLKRLQCLAHVGAQPVGFKDPHGDANWKDHKEGMKEVMPQSS